VRRNHQENNIMSEPPVALCRKAAARALSLSIATIDRAIKRGDLHAKKYGARVLVPRAEIDAYLEKLKKAGGSASLD
jgi:excisionase family DNA binding protein